MWTKKQNGQIINTCDKCNATNLPNLSQVRVAQILVMEVCEQCAQLEINEILRHRSPEAIAWYNTVIFNRNPPRDA